ncbi:MAG: hypothetical protein ACRDKT_09885 [Actinomycetota bacterium]
MEADINGPQRKVVASRVRPSKSIHGTSGIPIRDGKTLPFKVYRAWSGPAGYYPEQWFLVHPETKEVLHEGPGPVRLIWGLQSLTEFTDEVTTPLELGPGRYLIVFALGGLKGGELEVEAVSAESPAA